MLARLSALLRNPQTYVASVLGISFGLLVYGYWLVDLLPPTSKQILAYTALATVIGTAGFYFLIERGIKPSLPQITGGTRWGLVIGSVLIGAYLTYSYMNVEEPSARYITFLLPRETLEISVPANAGTAVAQAEIMGFKTSLGHISYSALQFKGWTRSGYSLKLTNPTGNSLEWSGRTGDDTAITLRTFSQESLIDISWNGENDRVQLPAAADGNYLYKHSFSIPFYASGRMLGVLGALDLIALSLAANILLWKNRAAILEGLRESASALLRPTEGAPNGGGDSSPARASSASNEWHLVVIIIGLALALRAFNLGTLYPYADEYSHLLAAKSLLQGVPLADVYQRSLLIVTVPVALFFRLFGLQFSTARMPGVLFNILAIIPLYLLTKKINRPVALLSCVLYSTSPWIIAVARNVREYAYYPFYFYWIVYGMVLFLERFPSHFVVLMDWRRLLRGSIALPGIALILPPMYGILIDPHSTFKLLLIAYGVFGLFLLGKFDLRSQSNLLVLGISALAGALAGYAAYIIEPTDISLVPRFNEHALQFFFTNPQQQWYFDRPAWLPIVAVIAAGVMCVWSIRSNFVPSFLAAVYLAFLLFSTAFFGRYVVPRYFFSLDFWHVVIIAMGLYAVAALLLVLPRKPVVMPLLLTTVFALIFNASQVLKPTLFRTQGSMPITGEYHYNMEAAHTYLLDRVKDEDALISSFYGAYANWIGSPHFRSTFPYLNAQYTLKRPDAYVLSIIEANHSGWVVLDSIAYSLSSTKPLPLKTTVVNSTEIDYVGYFGGEYIWKWNVLPSSP